MTPKRQIVISITLVLSHTGALALGNYAGRLKHHPEYELPLEYSYFQTQLAVATHGPETVLRQSETSLRQLKSTNLPSQSKERVLMQQAFILAIRSRAQSALHRENEAQASALEASRTCTEAGRKECDGARLVTYSKKILPDDWDAKK